MNNYSINQYQDIRLLNIEAECVEDWDFADATHVRIKLPPKEEIQFDMDKRGFFRADRMLTPSINLKANKIDYEKMVRASVEESLSYMDDVRRIAYDSFPVDRRFNVGVRCNPAIAKKVLDAWIDELDSVLICKIQEEVAGFLALKKRDGNKQEIHLAALDSKYRAGMAATSMYATAVLKCKAEGSRILFGNISTTNMSVMNLFSFLGATFSLPMDVYLKEL